MTVSNLADEYTTTSGQTNIMQKSTIKVIFTQSLGMSKFNQITSSRSSAHKSSIKSHKQSTYSSIQSSSEQIIFYTLSPTWNKLSQYQYTVLSPTWITNIIMHSDRLPAGLHIN